MALLHDVVRRGVAVPKGKAKAWGRFSKDSQPGRWFSRLQIAEDGGFSEVPKLFQWDRFFYALLSFGSLVLNLYVLSVPNVEALEKEQWLTGVTDSNRHLVINACIGYLTDTRLNPKVLLAILELGLLGVLLAGMFHTVGAILLSSCVLCDASVFWHHVWHLLASRLPELMMSSSLRLLNIVTPSVFVPSLSRVLAQCCDVWGVLRVVRFLVLRASWVLWAWKSS